MIMPYSYRSRRLSGRNYRSTKKKFYIYLLLGVLGLYLTFAWILPLFVNGIGTIRDMVTPDKIASPDPILNGESLAPPVLNVPFEATSTARVNIEGYANLGETVELFVDDTSKKEVTVDSNGKFRIEGIQLSIGSNTIYAKTKKGSTTSLPSKSFVVIYDIDKPTLKLNEPEDGKQITGDRNLKISGTTDSDSYIFINGNQVAVDSKGDFLITRQLSDGANIFEIKGTDKAGNTTTITRTVNFTP